MSAKNTAAVAAALASLLFAGCPGEPPGEEGPAAGSLNVGPAGGTFLLPEGGLLEVPQDAVTEPVQIRVFIQDDGIPDSEGRKRISRGFLFTPQTLKLSKPLNVVIPYLTERIPTAGIDPAKFDLRRASPNGTFRALTGAFVSATTTRVAAPSDQLGLFWVTSPSQAEVKEVTLSPREANLAVGGTLTFSASAKDPAGVVIPNGVVTFRVVPPRLGTVDATGKFTAAAPGLGRIIASSGDKSAEAPLRIAGPTVGPQSFLHENPFPTGNDLRGGGRVGSAAFFVGDNATVLSLVPGAGFTRLYSSPAVSLRAVAGVPGSAVAVGAQGTTGLLLSLEGSTVDLASLPTVDPRAVWYDGRHGMAVGLGNDVLVKFDGGWQTRYSPSVEPLLSVVGDGDGGFVTVGGRGSLYQFNPATQVWDSLYQTQLSTLLLAAQVADPAGREAWAVGGGKLWHFSQGGWTDLLLPASPALSELTCVGLSNGQVVVGGRANTTGHVLTYLPQGNPDGGSPWTTHTLRFPQVPRAVIGGTVEGFVVGDFGAVYHYDGAALTELSRGFYDDVVDLSVSQSRVAVATASRVYLREDAGVFTALPAPPTARIHSVLLEGPNVLVGGATAVYHSDGGAWTQLPMNGTPNSPVRKLRRCGTTLWAALGSGLTLRSGADGGLVLNTPLRVGSRAPDLYALDCRGPNEVWAAGDEALFQNLTLRDESALWRAVHSPGLGEAFVFGDARYGLFWDGEGFTTLDAPGGIPPDFVLGLWGSSPDNIYAVGGAQVPVPFGFALRFDGAGFRLVDSGSHRALTSIHGDATQSIWLGGRGGGVLRAIPR